MFFNIFEPVWPDNTVTTESAPNRRILHHTKWAMLMLMGLRLNQNVHILFAHVAIEVELCTEKYEVQT